MVKIDCQYPGCDYAVEHESEAIAVVMYQSHGNSHLQTSADRRNHAKPPQIARPEVKQDISAEEWYSFVEEWRRFKRITGLQDSEIADQLYQCCERQLSRLLLKENPNIIDEGEKALLEAIRKMAVLQVATSVRRTKLLSTKQEHGQLFREFFANVRAAASTCDFNIQCPKPCCKDEKPIDYTSKVVKDILVAGIADPEIRKDVLGHPDLDKMVDKEIVKLVEEKEMAKNAVTSTSDISALSTYRKQSKDNNNKNSNDSNNILSKKLSMKGKCGKCSDEMSLYIRFKSSGKLNKEPFKFCMKCHKAEQNKENSSVSTNFIDSMSAFDRDRADSNPW